MSTWVSEKKHNMSKHNTSKAGLLFPLPKLFLQRPSSLSERQPHSFSSSGHLSPHQSISKSYCFTFKNIHGLTILSTSASPVMGQATHISPQDCCDNPLPLLQLLGFPSAWSCSLSSQNLRVILDSSLFLSLHIQSVSNSCRSHLSYMSRI